MFLVTIVGVNICHACVSNDARGVQKRTLDSLELKLFVLVAYFPSTTPRFHPGDRP